MNYIVTGGAGFIGSHITEYLLDHGHDVTVVDNLFSGKKENLRHLLDDPHFYFIKGSITSPDLLKDMVSRCGRHFPPGGNPLGAAIDPGPGCHE